jgi:hypothetical protein
LYISLIIVRSKNPAIRSWSGATSVMTAIIWPARSAVQPVGRTKLHIGGRRDATGTLVIAKSTNS